LDTGKGTADEPYLSDMSVLELFFQTNNLLQNIRTLDNITLNLFFDISSNSASYQSHYLLDWEHPKAIVKFNPWNSLSQSSSADKITIAILSSHHHAMHINNWMSIYLSNIEFIFPNCTSNSISFSNINYVYLQATKVSATTNQIGPIAIHSTNVTTFIIENQSFSNI
jgi:ABC-type sulfate transport system substrate-binding protein